MIDKRMMYAQGQRVAKSSDGSRPGYRGDAAYHSYSSSSVGKDRGSASKSDIGSGAASNNVSAGSDNRGDPNVNVPLNQNPDVSLALRESIAPTLAPGQAENARLAVGQSQLDHLYDTGVSKINAPFGLPTPFTTALNFAKPLRDINLTKNIDYFRDLKRRNPNLKYDLTKEGYESYMKDRLSGYTDAAGNTNPNYFLNPQGNYVLRDGESEGIMEVADQTDDGTGDNNENGSLVLRYLHDYPDEVVNLQAMGVANTDEMLQIMLDRAKNLYTT